MSLAAGFEQATEADWRRVVEQALKGASFDRLRAATDDGFTIEPLYAGRRDAVAGAGRSAGRPWTIVTRIEHPDLGEANRLILDDLNGGAGGIELVTVSSNHARGGGLMIDTLGDLERLLEGVLLDLVTIRVDAGHETRPILAMLLALADKKGIPLSSLDIHAVVDPVGCMAHKGMLSAPYDKMIPRLWDLLHYLETQDVKGSVVNADGRIWHAGGASDAQELAFTLAEAVLYLRAADAAGIEGGTPSQDRVGVVMAADADQFATIAKLRAMRRLWARVLDASGLEQRPLHLHAETAWRMMTRRDPWVNMLRTTVAAFAAGVGGADSVTVLPFTEAIGMPDEFARRIARNTQSILIEEANVHRVADPAAGSGAVEARTDALARKAWEIFREVEAEGGILASYKEGRVPARIAEVRQARMRRIATRRDPLTGTSAFANLGEGEVGVLHCSLPDFGFSARPLDLPRAGKGELTGAIIAAVQDGATLSDLTTARDHYEPFDTERLPDDRLAEPFEALRDAADRRFEDTGDRPAVFLATIGRIADFTARADWARNLFAAGGIAAVGGGETAAAGEDPQAVASAVTEAFSASGAKVACLCSSDALYAEHAVEVALALKEAGAAAVFFAGKPADLEDALKGAGVTFAHEGCDVLAVLAHAHDRLGLG